jgi:hypothetical protein
MLLSRRVRTGALSLLAAVCLAPDAGPLPEETFTGTGEAGSGNATLRLGYYDNDDDGDGNPFLDEDLEVIEPIFLVDYGLTDRLGVWLLGSGDLVSSASIDRLNKFPEQSGASGDYYIGGDLGLRYELSAESQLSGFVHASTEYDYNSFGAGTTLARDFDHKNTTLSVALTGFRDTIDIIRFDGAESEGTDERWTGTAKLGWYQVIDPKTHGELSGTFTLQSGFLETAYNAVVVENPALPPNPNLDNLARGTEIAEELPGQRWRGSVQGRVRRQLWPGTALEAGGRAYADDWGLWALTAEPALYQRVFTDALQLRLGYRFTHQEATRYYEDHFLLTAPHYRTQDSDLGDWDAHGVGAHLEWSLSDSLKIDFGGEFVKRSDGIDPIFGSVGISKDF